MQDLPPGCGMEIFRRIVGQQIQSEFGEHVSEKVFLPPSGEHRRDSVIKRAFVVRADNRSLVASMPAATPPPELAAPDAIPAAAEPCAAIGSLMRLWRK